MIPDHRRDGKWVSCVDTKRERAYTFMGSQYYSMRTRCTPKSQVRRQAPTYAGCKLHRDWATFQAFAEWCSVQAGFSLGWELDKDLLVPRNKVYGPKTCTLLPRAINGAIRLVQPRLTLPGARRTKTGWLGVGVQADCSRSKSLGRFPSEQAAHEAYCASKEARVRHLAEEYKVDLDPRAYEALLKWTVKDYT